MRRLLLRNTPTPRSRPWLILLWPLQLFQQLRVIRELICAHHTAILLQHNRVKSVERVRDARGVLGQLIHDIMGVMSDVGKALEQLL